MKGVRFPHWRPNLLMLLSSNWLKTPPFHGEVAGSNPVKSTNLMPSSSNGLGWKNFTLQMAVRLRSRVPHLYRKIRMSPVQQLYNFLTERNICNIRFTMVDNTVNSDQICESIKNSILSFESGNCKEFIDPITSELIMN